MVPLDRRTNPHSQEYSPLCRKGKSKFLKQAARTQSGLGAKLPFSQQRLEPD
jgi:hypothetical protein